MVSKVEESRKRPKTGGRTAGTPNKVTRELKETILAALDGVGGVDYLTSTAKSHPAAFMALLGKVLPMTVAGDPENPLHAIVRIERVIVNATN